MLRKIILSVLVLAGFAGAARADDVPWVLKPPKGAVYENGTAKFDLVAVNVHERPIPIEVPDTLRGDLSDNSDRSPVELKRIGIAPRAIPPGGFVAVEYDLTVPTGVGERVLHLRDPIEVTTVVRVLPAVSERVATAPVAPPEVHSQLIGRPPSVNESGVSEYFLNKLSPYERLYFIVGDSPGAKFQISFKYQIFDQDSPIATKAPWVDGFYLAYTQTSLWDINAPSAPFFDTTYQPEFFWAVQDVKTGPIPLPIADKLHFDFQTGLQHDSNGKGGADSRTVNSFYVEPIATLGDRDNLFLTFAPKAYVYLGTMSDNPDITRYKGYFDLKFIMGEANGLQAAITGRVGDDWDKGSVELDVTYPLRKLFPSLDVYLHAQVFNGYGESLLEYNQTTTSVRFGLSLAR